MFQDRATELARGIVTPEGFETQSPEGAYAKFLVREGSVGLRLLQSSGALRGPEVQFGWMKGEGFRRSPEFGDP